MTQRKQRRFKNCKEIYAFFADEEYLIIFATKYGHTIYRTYSGGKYGGYDTASCQNSERDRLDIGRRYTHVGYTVETFRYPKSPDVTP